MDLQEMAKHAPSIVAHSAPARNFIETEGGGGGGGVQQVTHALIY